MIDEQLRAERLGGRACRVDQAAIVNAFGQSDNGLMTDHEQQPARRRCERCRGTGQIPGVTQVRPTGKGIGMGFDPGACPECDGAGFITSGGHYRDIDAVRIRRHHESRHTRK